MEIFPIVILMMDWLGSIQVLLIIDYEISADS